MRPPLDNGPDRPTSSLYVHLPFCLDRCLYCSFPTVADDPAAHTPLVAVTLVLMVVLTTSKLCTLVVARLGSCPLPSSCA